MQWCYRTGWLTVTAWLLLTWLRRASCELFVIHLNATTNVSLDVHLGDKVTVICPPDRYDNILYLRTIEQLIHCNASALPPSFTATDLDPYIDVGGCSGSSGPSFDIDVKRTPAFLETTVPFRKGGTFYFTSFTDGTAFSAAAKPTVGGDCTKGLSLVFNVIGTFFINSYIPSLITHACCTNQRSQVRFPVLPGFLYFLYIIYIMACS
jgi:hypothetical protein